MVQPNMESVTQPQCMATPARPHASANEDTSLITSTMRKRKGEACLPFLLLLWDPGSLDRRAQRSRLPPMHGAAMPPFAHSFRPLRCRRA